ncbi:PREDICTED: LEAF RUST 10 DISEASE-RESISTANCE LOCUS RECEPTOR-LIKE PROTEIN KINASE-like 2.1 [Lupinus angustifolius]|uniref:LEAF RUST 10 DISEASE-RESISTANCE LOCUS RECEPTOR-LIKE PROTEIN KINASE-like 2.1 n=1 Tax=Lupinus angustifolius TaxID=3871 RepID=UPI00092EB1A2|nr:PREDICTED: LEAF RUST 10 DISEASE-RESISTANCE LOCUS RECEPTOR-LIKE PROTEIN KINASE-like 2.1 [Lupinus angustifolius]
MVKETSNSFSNLSLFISTTLLLFQLTYSINHHQPCSPSSCGKIHNITYPFRLKSDPIHCGDSRYELECNNNNNSTLLLLPLFSAKYIVQHIDYNAYKIILTDPGVVQDSTCSFIPRYFLSYTSFKTIIGPDDFGSEPFTNPSYLYRVGYFNCTNPVTINDDYDLKYVKVDVSNCTEYGNNEHVYVVLETTLFDYRVSDIRVGCSLKVATLAGTRLSEIGNDNVSYDEIRRVVAEGFEVSWFAIVCEDECGKGVDCEVVDEKSGQVKCDKRYCHYAYHTTDKCGFLQQIIGYTAAYLRGIIIGIYSRISFSTRLLDNPVGLHYFDAGTYIGRNILPSFVAIRYLFGVAFFLLLMIFKWRRRHLSMYENIENFLLDNNNLNPIRYEYKEIKKMSGGFNVKLGQGGFGSVYKGKLRSGVDVAIKMLSKFNPNGQDFINEVATIGRIHHVNVVRLVGYCVEGKKRALVYEFMPNGSLDKYIFSKEESSVHLSYAKIYEISLGIAHGIEYLHQGCDMQILHFDIKPHNILLDENFIPKVSDFGLARLYPLDGSIAPLTQARGTLGYMAPELFYKNIGGLSYKVDVYSFGMLLMEMTSKRKNSNPHAEHSSQAYFPFWIHDRFLEEKDIEIENASDEDNDVAKRMFLVALWCIQLKPSDRPSMSKVVEMLEGKTKSLEMPPRPSYYPQEKFQHDDDDNDDFNSNQTSWSGSSSFDGHHGQTITNHQESSAREIET